MARLAATIRTTPSLWIFIPSFRATASAVVRLSPVSMMMRMPSSWSRRMASGAEARIVVLPAAQPVVAHAAQVVSGLRIVELP